MPLRMRLVVVPVLAALLGSALAGLAPSLEHDTDVDKGARPNRRLFLVDLIRPPSTQDPLLTNEVDTSADGDVPQAVRVLVEADDSDYLPRAAAPKPADASLDGPSDELLPPPEDQKGLSFNWKEPSRDLEPPPVQQPNIDWSKVDFQNPAKPAADTDQATLNGKSNNPEIATELQPPPQDSYLPKEPSSGKPGYDDFLSFGGAPSEAATSAYEKVHGDSYLPEAGEVKALSEGPVHDDYLAIGELPKEAEPIDFSRYKDSYFPEGLSKSDSKVDDYLAIGEPPKEEATALEKSDHTDSYSPEAGESAAMVDVPPGKSDDGQEAKDYVPEAAHSKRGSDDFVAIGVPPRRDSIEDYWTASVKDDYLAIGVPPLAPAPDVPEVPEASEAPKAVDAPADAPRDHDHVHDHHEHVHDEVHATTPQPEDEDEEGSDDEVDGDGKKMSESKDYRKKRHICKMCGGYGGGYAVPPISVTIVKQPVYGGGGGYCDVCGRPQPQPVYQKPVYRKPVYRQPVYQQPVYQQPVYQQPCNTCNQPPPPPPPQPVCNTCGGGGGGNSGSYSQSSSQSSSSSSSYSNGWGKK